MVQRKPQNRSRWWKTAAQLLVVICLPFLSAAVQGPILTLTPGSTIVTVAGNGQATFGGDNGAATSAALAFPFALAADASGNIYVADTNNHRIRKIDTNGNITTVAGNGEQGFFGDSGAATSAALNQPTAVAVDASGKIYISDSGNNRVRVVTSGTITTFAGNGTAGFSGDNGAAISAALSFPRGVAVDNTGNVYIADTNNHRIRKVASGTITTLAGNGEEGFAGDNGAAASAILDTPTGVAVDASGNVLIADSNNHRIRKVASGTITTIAGNGSAALSGNNGPATSASLAHPLGVGADSAGNVYIADSNNHVVRRINGAGTITTLAGNGQQGFFGDNGLPVSASLDTPAGIVSLNGSLYVADKNNERIRRVDSTILSFGNQIVGTTSAVQTVTAGNAGGLTLTIASITPSSADFALAGSGSCGTSFPHNIAAGANCTLDVVFVPTTVGAINGSLSVSDNAPGSPHGILASGTGIQDGTTVAITSAPPSPSFGTAVTITATITPTVATTAPAPTGTVAFSEGGVVLATRPVSGSAASFITSTLGAGSHTITATYSGDTLYTGSSASFTQVVSKATPTITWATPAAITYGTPLSATQLNATASVAGTFVYAPASGTVLNAGTQTLSVTFTPTDAADYNTATASVSLTVNQAATTTTLTATPASIGAGATVTFTATVTSAGGTPTGSISFFEGSTSLSTTTLSNGSATFVTSTLTVGMHLITAVYAGSTNFLGSTSNVFTETIGSSDFLLAPGANGGPFTIPAGQVVQVSMTVTPTGSPGGPVQFSLAGLPPSSTAVFSPATLTLGTSATTVTLTVTTQARFRYVAEQMQLRLHAVLAGMMWLPLAGLALAGRVRRKWRLWLVLAVMIAPAIALGGCASANNFKTFGTPAGTYNLVITATSATTQRTINVTVVVQ